VKDIIFILSFAVLGIIFLLEMHDTSQQFNEAYVDRQKAFENWDKKMFGLNQRLNRLEQERDMEGRLTDVEKALRTFCVGSKTEMCGQLGPVIRRRK
jgi:hypothetical protein